MKIDLIKEEDTFKPFKVTITFETAEEVHLIRSMCTYNCSIPETVSPFEPDQEIIKKFLDNLRLMIHAGIL